MQGLLDNSVGLPGPDREEIEAAARRFFEAGLCCVLEAEQLLDGERVPAGERWDPCLVVFRGSVPGRVLEAVEETVALNPGARLRIVGYDCAQMAPASIPAPVICSPPGRPGPREATRVA